MSEELRAPLDDEDRGGRRDENVVFAQQFVAAHRETFERLGE